MSLIGLLASTEKMVPGGCLHMRPFQFYLEEHWRYPQSLDNFLPLSETISGRLECWQNPVNVKGADLHSKDHSIQIFTDASNKGWGAHLEEVSTKGLWSDGEKRLHINVLELKAESLALKRFKDQYHNQTVLVATDKSTVVAYINSKEENHDLVPSLPDNKRNQAHSNRMVFKQICQKWFTLHVDLFPTRLNHKVKLYVSIVRDQLAWDIDTLNINWLGLTPYAYPPTAPLHRVIQKSQAKQLPHHSYSPRLARDALVLGPSAALNRDPTPVNKCQQHFSNSPTTKSFTTFYNISTSMPSV